jgi:hypothetical protein
MTDMTVANTIALQIGSRAFFLMGTRYQLDDEDSLTFDCRGSKTVNKIRARLNVMDLYDLTFWKVTRRNGEFKVKVVDVRNDIYFGALREVIERVTGLSLRLSAPATRRFRFSERSATCFVQMIGSGPRMRLSPDPALLTERKSAMTTETTCPLCGRRTIDPLPVRERLRCVECDALAKAAPRLLQACKAVLHAIASADLDGRVLWILPPYQADGDHESANERLEVVIEEAEGITDAENGRESPWTSTAAVLRRGSHAGDGHRTGRRADPARTGPPA